MRLRLAHDGLADLLGFNDAARLADDSGIRHDALAIDDFWLRHDSLLVHDARLDDDFRLVDQARLTDFLRLRHDVLVDHSALGVDDLFLAHNLGRLLDLDELRSALLGWADAGALRHGTEVLRGVALRSALEVRKVERKQSASGLDLPPPALTSLFSQGTIGN